MDIFNRYNKTKEKVESLFNFNADLKLIISFNEKYNQYYIHLVTPFYEVGVFTKLSETVLLNNKNNTEFLINEFFNEENQCKDPAELTADYFHKPIITIKGAIKESNKRTGESISLHTNGKNTVLFLDWKDRKVSDRREVLSGRNIYKIINNDNFEINRNVFNNLHFLSSHKTAANGFSDIVKNDDLIDKNGYWVIDHSYLDFSFGV